MFFFFNSKSNAFIFRPEVKGKNVKINTSLTPTIFMKSHKKLAKMILRNITTPSTWS